MKILINNVFVGGYGFEKNNLPHEMINFFRADNNNFYVYVTPYGTVDNKIEITDLRAILFVRSAGEKLVEVMAKAEIEFLDKDDFFTRGVQLGGDKDNDAEYKNIKSTAKSELYHKLVDSENISYGGVSLDDIHRDNKKDNEILVTMKVKRICLPKKTFYLTHDSSKQDISPDFHYVEGKKMANQSMKTYFDESDNESAYVALDEIIKDKNNEFWQDESSTTKYSKKGINEKTNFFKIVRQQDNEVMFSNMFYFYFSEYPELRMHFVKDVLKGKKQNISLSYDCVVEREKNHMDLRFIDDANYIIIENKIKSSINGMKKAKNSAEFEKVNGKYLSQLNDYYEIAMKTVKDPNHIFGFIFTPDYNDINKDNYLNGDKYEKIYYSEICKYFEEYENKYGKLNDRYFNDFVDALKKHITPIDNEYRDELMKRLAFRISKNSR